MAGGEENGVRLQVLDETGNGSARVPGVQDDPSLSDESIRPAIRAGALRTFDVFSLIVNKMIGTGIYSAPASVLLLTGNKSLTLGLFAVGFLYSIVRLNSFSMFIYLDYAAALPFTGGELVYLDEITAYSGNPIPTPQPRVPSDSSSSRMPKPSRAKEFVRKWLRKISGDGLLAYVVYSFLFVGIFNSGTNSMQTGRMILLCIQANQVGNLTIPARLTNTSGSTTDTRGNLTEEAYKIFVAQAAPDLHGDLVRFIGVVTLTTLCLIQYFSAQSGRRLNRYFAVVKIAFLLILIVAGGVKASETPRGRDGKAVDMAAEWHTWFDTGSKLNFAKALLAVLFSFEGWENATFVAGEIPIHRQGILRKGFITAVLVVGTLYLCVAAVFLDAIPYEFISGLNGVGQNVNYAPMFFDNGTKAERAWAIMAAISSIGSLNSIIYTFSRVKQAIGQANILPWSKVWAKDDIIRRNDRDDLMHKSPQGGLILHWLMSVVVIAGTSSIKNTIEAISLPGYLQTYTHCFILMIMSASFLRLPSRERALRRIPPRGVWRPSQMTGIPRYILGFALFIYSLVNLLLLVVNVIPPYRATDGKSSSFKGFGFPAILFSLLFFGVSYYLLVFGAAARVFPAGRTANAAGEDDDDEGLRGMQLRKRESGMFKQSVLGWADVKVEVRKDYEFNTGLERVHRFGRRWRMRWILDPRYRHPDLSSFQEEGVNVTGSAPGLDGLQPEDHVNLLYWVFGGGRQLNKTPWDRVEERWEALGNWFNSFLS